MKLRMSDGRVITIMGVPRPRQPIDGDEFAESLERWIYLSVAERDALFERMRAYPDESWAKREYLPWVVANLRIPTLPREGVTLLPHSREEEDAIRAYWDGWAEQSERVWEFERNWSTLTRAQREEGLALAELMAADFPLAVQLRDWMKEHLAD